MNRTLCALGAAAITALSLSGCYTTTIQSGRPASPATVGYDQRWHHGLFSGIAELSPAYDLSQVCPQGWAEIETETSFLNGLLALLSEVYTSQTVTIRCATTPSAAPTPPTAAAPVEQAPAPPAPPPAPAAAAPPPAG